MSAIGSPKTVRRSISCTFSGRGNGSGAGSPGRIGRPISLKNVSRPFGTRIHAKVAAGSFLRSSTSGMNPIDTKPMTVITADATVERLEATITSIDDLHGRDVVVVDGTAAASFLDERGVTARPVATSSDRVEAVASGAAEAVVDDSAILRYLVTQRNGDAVEVVGPTLRTEHYGIALRPGSDLVERVNLALLRVTGSVAYDRLVDAYFG